MADLPVILFPHCHLADTDLEKIISLFGGITICQPWFMDESAMASETEDFSLVNFIRPPERLKPQGSPLYEALEEEVSLRSFFEDIPRSEIDESFE